MIKSVGYIPHSKIHLHTNMDYQDFIKYVNKKSYIKDVLEEGREIYDQI